MISKALQNGENVTATVKATLFPAKMVFTRFAKDTLDYTIPKTEHKILVYVDSIGCTCCKLQLPQWKNFAQLLDTTSSDHTPILIVLNTKNIKDIQTRTKA